jgi:hypothetical protein
VKDSSRRKVNSIQRFQKLAAPFLSEKSYHFHISLIALEEYPRLFNKTLNDAVTFKAQLTSNRKRRNRL